MLRRTPLILHQHLLRKKNFTACSLYLNKPTMPKQIHARRIDGIDKNVWVEFTRLAAEYKVVNLGQGFPDFSPPEFAKEYFRNAIFESGGLLNQYTRAFGHPLLVKVLAQFFSKFFGQDLDANFNVLVTVGAYQALFCTFQALIDEGDEVIIIEPFFDCYEPMVKMAGGTPIFIPLRPKSLKEGAPLSSGDWVLDPEELAAKFTAKTKAIVINSPNNPLGKVYKKQELEMIAELCIKKNVLCFSDEVYEWLVYDGTEHVRIASLPGMWDRTITVGSAGKTFSATGWKVGWAFGPDHLLKHLRTVHQNSLYHCPTAAQMNQRTREEMGSQPGRAKSSGHPRTWTVQEKQKFKEAVARSFQKESECFGKPESYFLQLPKDLRLKRDQLVKCLTDVGMKPIVPEGGYFLIADISGLKTDLPVPSDNDESYDYSFVKWMIKNKGLATIPVSAFYSSENKKNFSHFIRFCFAKKDDTLTAAGKILQSWNPAN